MQLSLGGLIGEGPAQQNRVTASRGSVLRSRDSLQVYGWWTSSLRTANTDAELGIRYRTPLRRIAGGSLIGGGGLEHWYFPSVLTGTRDIAVDSYIGWTGVESQPVTISANAKTVLNSDLQKGSLVCLQASHTKTLLRSGKMQLALQHGPAYVYSSNLYGRNGHRVARYYGTLLVSTGAWTFEAMLRPQLGLQPGIPDNRYWSVALIRRFTH